jgi:SAM-dependent methyltransferase
MPIRSVLDFAHALVTSTLDDGEVAIDATVGNGHDTVALARAVGATGRVFGFDVQKEAIESTRTRLERGDVGTTIDLVHAGHEDMDEHLPDEVHGRVGAATFNLGYLPGSPSDCTTSPETTLPALDATLRVLRPGGVVTVVLYTGHDGGQEEAEAVDAWAAELSQERFHALSYQFVNQQNDPPRLVAVEKRSADAPAQ